MSKIMCLVACGLAAILASSARAEDKKIEAKMTCSAYSGNPQKQPAFQVLLPLTFSGGLFTAERKLITSPGKETFYGLIGRLTTEVVLIGEGRTDDGTGVWVYEFHGKFNPDKTTVLKGGLKSTLGAVGSRSCSIEFG